MSNRGSPPPPLPADDSSLFTLSIDELAERWAEAAARTPLGAEAMTGADRRAQRQGIPGLQLMEHAGTAVAAAARALADDSATWGRGPILVLCGPRNESCQGQQHQGFLHTGLRVMNL